jgi:hypothetical protein
MTPITPELLPDDAGRIVEPTLLIPLPGPYESLEDADVLTAWYNALTNIIGSDVPHDLLALWVYTPKGAQLIGPASLAQDNLRIPAARAARGGSADAAARRHPRARRLSLGRGASGARRPAGRGAHAVRRILAAGVAGGDHR